MGNVKYAPAANMELIVDRTGTYYIPGAVDKLGSFIKPVLVSAGLDGNSQNDTNLNWAERKSDIATGGAYKRGLFISEFVENQEKLTGIKNSGGVSFTGDELLTAAQGMYQQRGFVQNLARAYDKDSSVIDNLANTLQSNPQLRARMQALVEKNPAAMNQYAADLATNPALAKNPTHLDNRIKAQENALAARDAAAKSAANRTPPSPIEAAAVPPKTSPAKQQTGGGATPRRPGLEGVAETIDEALRAGNSARTSTSSPTQPPAQPPRGAADPAVTEISDAEAAKATTSTETSTALVMGEFGPNGRARAAIKSEFPELAGKVDGFADYVSTHPQAAANLAGLMNRNPELLKMMTGEGGEGMDPAMRTRVKKFAQGPISDLMSNPQKLEEKEYIANIESMARSGQGIMKGMEAFKGLTGIDVGKIMDEMMPQLKGFLSQIMSWVGGFIGNMGDGNFLSQAGGQGGISGMLNGFLGNVQGANANAAFRADNDARIAVEVEQTGGLYDRTRDGKISDGTDRYPAGHKLEGREIKYTNGGQGQEVVLTTIKSADGKSSSQWVPANNGEPIQGGIPLTKEEAAKIGDRYVQANDDRVKLKLDNGKTVDVYAANYGNMTTIGAYVTSVDVNGKVSGTTVIRNGQVVEMMDAKGNKIEEQAALNAMGLGRKSPELAANALGAGPTGGAMA